MSKEIMTYQEYTLSEIKHRLLESFDLIRGSLNTSDYHVLLLLLVLHSKGVLNSQSLSNPVDLKKDIRNLVKVYDGENSDVLRDVYQIYEPIVNSLNDDVILKLLRLFHSVDQKLFKESFYEIFEYLLNSFSGFQGKFAGIFYQPKELTLFLGDLVQIPLRGNVYNPFAGINSFVLNFYFRGNIIAQENNHSVWALGILRMMAYELDNLSGSIFGNSISDWNPTSEKFDLIISNPPFGMRLPPNISGKFGTIRTAEQFLVEKGIDDLKPDGKLVVVLSQGFLFRSGSEQNLRQYLIENDLIEMVISLPGGLFMQTGIPIVILVINKNKKDKKGVVRFIDGKNSVSQSGKLKVLDTESLHRLVQVATDSDSVRIVKNEFIIENDFNLNVSRYFQVEFEGAELRSVIEPIRGQRNNGGVTGKIVRIKELKDDKFNYILNVEELDEIQITYPNQVISESCLLIASIGEKLKSTYFDFTGVSIHTNPNVMAFKVDQKEIDLNYLISELNADRTLSQVKSFVSGSVMPRLRKEDFLSVKIELPTLSEQRAKVKGLKEEHIKGKEKELGLEKELLGFKDEAFREFAAIKHTFRQYLNALKSNVSGTRKFISKHANQNITIDSIYSANLNRTFGQHLLSLEGTIDSMSKLLVTVDDHLSEASAIEVDLEKLIEESQNRFANNDIFQFEKLKVDWESFRQGDGELIMPMIEINPDDFFRIFSNIISNAVDHGFKSNRGNNIIRTSLSFDAENLYCNVEVSNNGKGIDTNFTLKHLVTRGEKTSDSPGSGVGGADIKSLLDKYQGYLDLRNEYNAEFPVTYEISLPLKVYEI